MTHKGAINNKTPHTRSAQTDFKERDKCMIEKGKKKKNRSELPSSETNVCTLDSTIKECKEAFNMVPELTQKKTKE